MPETPYADLLFAPPSIDPHQGACRGFGGFPIRGRDITHSRANRLVPKLLFHQGEIYIRGNQVAGNRMLESMGVPLFRRQPSSRGNGLEEPKELAAVQSATFLRDEQEI